MADFEEINDNHHHQPPSPPPAPSTNIPDYPQMIMAAIEAINDPNDSNKSTISSHIESNYPDLPPAHSALLVHNLDKLKSSGQLVLRQNNYVKPDPSSPLKRGRGRPPKPKVPGGTATTVPIMSPRPRGRPPKPRDPLSPLSGIKKPGSGRPRGRPPKIGGSIPTMVAASGGGSAKRGRGRPPKTGTGTGKVAAPVAVAVDGVMSGGKRGRGRPSKVKPAAMVAV